jgi:hypothetical protein
MLTAVAPLVFVVDDNASVRKSLSLSDFGLSIDLVPADP